MYLRLKTHCDEQMRVINNNNTSFIADNCSHYSQPSPLTTTTTTIQTTCNHMLQYINTILYMLQRFY